MSSKELTEWAAYQKYEPFGEGRADYRIGSLMALIANAISGKKGKNYKPEDFIPEYGPKETQTAEEQMAAMGIDLNKVRSQLVDKHGDPL